jgi:hypothetical protein
MLVLIAMASASCTAPQYDDQTDKLITQLQSDVDTQFVMLISFDHQIAMLSGKTDAASQKALSNVRAMAGYDSNVPFYNKVDVDLLSLRLRVDAEPSAATPMLDDAIKNLRDNLLTVDGSVQATHQTLAQQNPPGVMSALYLRDAQAIVDVQIGKLLTRELGLKTGSSPSSSGTASPGTGAAATPASK